MSDTAYDGDTPARQPRDHDLGKGVEPARVAHRDIDLRGHQRVGELIAIILGGADPERGMGEAYVADGGSDPVLYAALPCADGERPRLQPL